MPKFIIDKTKCKTCGICSLSCPVYIIENGTNGVFPSINAQNESRCVYCGHCESICPEQALIHELSENSLQSPEIKKSILDPMQIQGYFKNRRSVRNYLSKKIDKSIFENILETVRYAPTGTNRQMNHWTIISDSNVIKQLSDGTIEWMKDIMKTKPEMGNKYNFPAIIIGYKMGADVICRKAPHLCICSTPAVYGAGSKDAVIAASHLELIFPAYGIGSCWAGFLMLALQSEPGLKNIIGLSDSYTVHATLMAGYPKFSYYTIPPRNKLSVNWV